MSEAKRLLEQATPLPWEVRQHDMGPLVAGAKKANGKHDKVAMPAMMTPPETRDADCALIVYAVNHLPDYEAAVEALERLVAVLGPASIIWTDPVPADSQFALTDARAALARLRESVPA